MNRVIASPTLVPTAGLIMIQFKVSRFLGLTVQVDGMAMVNERGIQLAFNQPEDADKLWEADTETVIVPWDQIVDWEVDYGFIVDRIRLKVKSTDVFGRLPGVNDNQVELDVRKADRDRLEEFETRGKEYQSGQRKDDAADKLDDIRDFLYDIDDED